MLKIIQVNGIDDQAFLREMSRRSGEVGREVNETVSAVLADVKERGDAAVEAYTKKFDGCWPQITSLEREALKGYLQYVDPALLRAMERAAENIRTFHEGQKQQSRMETRPDGVVLGQRVRGLARVGLYVPGGTAAYPSSVLMNAIPARIAGVGELIMATPPGKGGKINYDILAAAYIGGVDKVFFMGGAQAVGALGYGTETVPKVDKIVGPGNIYVATAKKLLYGVVDIDMIAGPSEILILADSSADPAYIAADLLSQAEHDVLASALLLTDSKQLAEAVAMEVGRQAAKLQRQEIIEASLKNYSAILVCNSIDQMVDMANMLAPEHLEVLLPDPFAYIGRLDNAGSVFLGAYAPESLGDYYAGPNHVLPTSGTARFFSPLSVDSFLKKSSFIYYPKEALAAAGADIITFAEAEGFTAHAQAVRARLK